ncbi:AMP-binding enzyme [Aspergillus sclerotialis]|uniref:AMP-binding enzyme n=1 Tax=Aspergillus sclerotialis TaxID=2070753 RepID=A0A3A2ZLZ8_9EURO|nr:AMP-binding enzyme [Aspergillus sclerotialis]
MAPSVIQLEDCQSITPLATNLIAKKPVKTTSYQAPKHDTVELTVSKEYGDLLSQMRANYQEDLDIVTILNVCWIVTVRCFTPSTVIYLESHPWTSICHISNTFIPGSCCVSALELQPEDPLKELVRNVRLIRTGIDVSSALVDNVAPDTGKQFLTSAIRFVGGCHALPESILNFKTSDTKVLLDIATKHGKIHAKLTFALTDMSKEFATSLLHTFDHVLSSIVSSPSQPIEQTSLCSEHDLQLIKGFTEKISETNNTLLHDMCMEHARLTPDAEAICSWDGNMTYRELDEATSKLAKYLVDMGVGPETFVLSCFEKSKWPIISRLAILKAGAAYISVDATDPPIYLNSVIERVNAQIMLVSPKYESKYTSMVPNLITLTHEMLSNLPLPEGPVCTNIKPTDACLILFTSGSTGQPKGIIQEHRTYATAIRDYVKVMGMGPHSRVFQFDDYAFDISNNDYLTALTAGGCCCVPTPEKTIPALITNVATLKANTTFITPTTAIRLEPRDVPTLELVCMGGEPMSNDLILKWSGHVKLVNQYGMGEAATFCAYNDAPKVGENAVVGRPGSGAIWISNPASPELPMPVGAVGEILIEGPHLSRGYLDDICLRPDVGFLKSTPKWISDLHPSRAGTRIYRSGDLGRYRHDGTVEHMGRKDTLLKINGTRVESTEVEYVLRKSLTTGDFALVDLLGNIDGVDDPELTSFIYLADNPMNLVPEAPDDDMSFLPITERHSVNSRVAAMKANIKATLPEHMFPSLFLLVDKIPRTRSNKTDRRKLHHIAQKYYLKTKVNGSRTNGVY